jgi:hypothetical protein
MQIHELTQRNIREASIADRIKSAGTAVAQAVKNPRQTVQQAKQGFDDKMAVANVSRGTAQQQQTQAQAAKYAEKLRRQGYTGQTAAIPTSAVQPGQRIKIVATLPNGTQSIYYKTDKGWENELGQPIKNANSIAYLEKLYARQSGTGTTSAGAVQTTQAGVVQTGAGASSVMTTVDVDQAIRQMGLSQQQLQAFQAQVKQNPGFVQAFLKRLGLTR